MKQSNKKKVNMHNPHVPFGRPTTEWIHIFYGTACDQVFVKMSVERCRWHTMAVAAVTHRLQTDTRFKLYVWNITKWREKQTRKRYEPSFVIRYMTSFAQTSLQAYKQNFPRFCFTRRQNKFARRDCRRKARAGWHVWCGNGVDWSEKMRYVWGR